MNMPVNQNQANIYKIRNSFSFHTDSETFKFERYYLKIKKSIDPKENNSYIHIQTMSLNPKYLRKGNPFKSL